MAGERFGEFTVVRTEMVPPSKLSPHPFRDDGFVTREPTDEFLKKLRQAGRLTRAIITNQDYEIIDGMKRWGAVGDDRLDWDKVWVQVRKYETDRGEEWDIFNANDYEQMSFIQKVKAAKRYKEWLEEPLKERQKKGKSLEELQEDPHENDPAQHIAKGNIDAAEWAADKAGFGNRETLRQALRLWELAQPENSDTEGHQLAVELVNRLESGDFGGIRTAYEEVEEYLDLDESESSEESTKSETSREPISDGEYHFLPVIGIVDSGLMTSHGNNEPMEIGGRVATWWEDVSVIPQYPYIFISPFNDKNVPAGKYDWIEAFRYGQTNATVVCDSGGYEKMKGTIDIVDDPAKHSFSNGKIHPETVVEWQVRNSDIGPILDDPPFGRGRNPTSYSEFEHWENTIFRPCMRETLEYAERMADKLAQMRSNGIKRADEFIQLGVIQGRLPRDDGRDEYRLIKDWHEEMLDAMGQPDGWGLSAKRPWNLYHQGAMLAYSVSNFDNPIHIHVFQAGSIRLLALIEFFSMRTGWSVTSDTISHISRGSQAGTVAPPGHPGSSYDMNVRSQYTVDRYPCRCSVCTAATDDGYDVTSGGAEQGHIRNFHNLHQFLEFKEMIAGLIRYYGRDVVRHAVAKGDNTLEIRTDNRFWTAMFRNMKDESKLVDLWRAMAAVDQAVEKGYEHQDVRDLLRGRYYAVQIEMDAMQW